MGPHLGPLHHHLVPFGTPSGTPYPLSHRGRVPRGVLIPMCHVTKCSSDPFTLIPTRRYRTGYGSSDGVYPWGDPILTPPDPLPTPFWAIVMSFRKGSRWYILLYTGIWGPKGGAYQPQRGWEWPQMGSHLGPFGPHYSHFGLHLAIRDPQKCSFWAILDNPSFGGTCWDPI